MQPNISKSRSGSDQKRRERMSHMQPSSSMPKSMKMTVKDFNWHKSNDGAAIATSVDEIQFSYRKGNGNGYKPKGGQGKPCRKCGQSHPPRECPVWGQKVPQVWKQKSFYYVLQDEGHRRMPKTETNTDWPVESHKTGRKSRSRHRRHVSEDSEDRSKSRYYLKTYNFPFKTILQPPWETTLVTPWEDFPFKTLMKDWHVQEANILPIRFSSGPCFLIHWTFMATQKTDSWEDQGQTLNVITTESWSIMAASHWNFSIIQMRSFQDHSFYVVETRMPKDIMVRYAASIRLGLFEVLCKNISKSVSNRKEDKYQLQRFLSRPLLKNRWQNLTEEPESCIKVLSRPSTQFFQDHSYLHMQWHSFQDPSQHTGQEKAIEVDSFQDPWWCRQHKSHWRNVYWDSFQDPSQHRR